MTTNEAVAIVKDEATKSGVTWDDDCAHFVLWELTGWPAFFIGDPKTEIRRQVREALVVPGTHNDL